MTKEVKNISTRLLSNNAHFEFVKSVAERAEKDATVSVKQKAEVEALRKAFTAEDESLHITQKSSLTYEISDADNARNAFYMGFKSIVGGFSCMPDGTDEKNASNALQAKIDEYKISVKMSLAKETGALTNFISDVEAKFTAEVTTLGLVKILAFMKENNEKVHDLLGSRDTEKSVKVVGALKTCRAASDEALKSLFHRINAFAEVEGDDAYKDFVDAVNTQIDRYKQQELSQKSGKKSQGSDDNHANAGDAPKNDSKKDNGKTDLQPEKPKNDNAPANNGGNKSGDGKTELNSAQ